MVNMKKPCQSPESARTPRRALDDVRQGNSFVVRISLAVLLLIVGSTVGWTVGFELTLLAAIVGLHLPVAYPCSIAGTCFALYVVIRGRADRN
jgi:hypothetical protein